MHVAEHALQTDAVLFRKTQVAAAAAVVALGACAARGEGPAAELPPTTDTTAYYGASDPALEARGTLRQTTAEVIAESVVVGDDGAPMPNVRAGISTRHAGFGAALAGMVGACDPDAVSCGASGSATRTRGDGTFRAVLRGKTDDGYVIYAQADEYATPHTEVRVGAPAPEAQLPPLYLWRPHVGISETADEVVLDYSKLPASGVGDLTFYSLIVRPKGDRVEFWRENVLRSTASIPRALLEDLEVEVLFTAGTVGTLAGADMDFTFVSQPVRLARQQHAPVSRGAPCVVPDANGRAVRQEPCGLTDGKWSDDYALPSDLICGYSESTAGCHRDLPEELSVTVDVQAAPVSPTIVVRGCLISCEISTSADGERWTITELRPDDGETAVAAVPGAVRFVKVNARVARGLTEMSVIADGGKTARILS